MTRTEAHPIEVLLVVALLALEAAVTVITALVALLLTVARWKPQASPKGVNTTAPSGEPESPKRGMTPPAPLLHPLQALTSGLEALSCRELMAMAGTRRKLPKHQLIALVAACS
ncbi:MAG: hypothetical protein RLZZ631_586 [Cyanobacteriota bacterium]